MSAEDWSGYDSGVFCHHWSSIYDCKKLCVCEHLCKDHDWEESVTDCKNHTALSFVFGKYCSCKKFNDKNEKI